MALTGYLISIFSCWELKGLRIHALGRSSRNPSTYLSFHLKHQWGHYKKKSPQRTRTRETDFEAFIFKRQCCCNYTSLVHFCFLSAYSLTTTGCCFKSSGEKKQNAALHQVENINDQGLVTRHLFHLHISSLASQLSFFLWFKEYSCE